MQSFEKGTREETHEYFGMAVGTDQPEWPHNQARALKFDETDSMNLKVACAGGCSLHVVHRMALHMHCGQNVCWPREA